MGTKQQWSNKNKNTAFWGLTDSRRDLKVQYKDDRARLNVLFSANRLQLCTKALGNVPIMLHDFAIFCL